MSIEGRVTRIERATEGQRAPCQTCARQPAGSQCWIDTLPKPKDWPTTDSCPDCGEVWVLELDLSTTDTSGVSDA